VRLVEAVLREFFEQVEDGVGLLFGDVVRLEAAFDENEALAGHFGGVLLSHRAAEQVSLPSEKPASTFAACMTCSW
jgi:hypothetical protein